MSHSRSSRCEKVALVGPNGAGKSTLILHLIGILTGQGEVHAGGLPVVKENLSQVRAACRPGLPVTRRPALLADGLRRRGLRAGLPGPAPGRGARARG